MNQAADSTRVLIVDDEPNIVMAIEFLLQRAGYQTSKAYNGEQALELAAEIVPDIVVLDVMMPGIDGFEVARRIRQSPTLEYTKIVFLTAKGTQRDKQAGYANGAEAYLIKPFDNDELVMVVNEMLAYG
ncbi:MAG: response regulator [Saprospiraceae bacterium]|nr:response regulator [Saprospiraceae bacterium]